MQCGGGVADEDRFKPVFLHSAGESVEQGAGVHETSLADLSCFVPTGGRHAERRSAPHNAGKNCGAGLRPAAALRAALYKGKIHSLTSRAKPGCSRKGRPTNRLHKSDESYADLSANTRSALR